MTCKDWYNKKVAFTGFKTSLKEILLQSLYQSERKGMRNRRIAYVHLAKRNNK